MQVHPNIIQVQKQIVEVVRGYPVSRVIPCEAISTSDRVFVLQSGRLER